MRNPAIALGAATLVSVLVVALILFAQVSGLRDEVSTLSTAVEGSAAEEGVLDSVRDLDSQINSIRVQLDDIAERLDRIDASVAEIPTEAENDTRIGTILSEVRALQDLLGGLSVDLGIICDFVGC